MFKQARHSEPYFVFVGCGTRENDVSDLEKRGCLRSETKQSSRGFVPIRAILAEKSKPLYNRKYWIKKRVNLWFPVIYWLGMTMFTMSRQSTSHKSELNECPIHITNQSLSVYCVASASLHLICHLQISLPPLDQLARFGLIITLSAT